ncbi:hypothetical protein L596_021899 [Steinernema carpocapsae]|uniref:DnaJ homolog subfamily B member 9 n=1 Tax=Steinernema carpocapsae TaxID=34508 RepID=A0A4U5MK75_STECR|nr:hypothetical protein L596_021899 [Steinernema carpocapsae]
MFPNRLCPKNFYDLLGIRQNATNAELREAYNSLTRNYHPFTATREEVDKHERIHAAYDVLRDSSRRQRYDQILARNAGIPSTKPTFWEQPIM